MTKNVHRTLLKNNQSRNLSTPLHKKHLNYTDYTRLDHVTQSSYSSYGMQNTSCHVAEPKNLFPADSYS